MARESVLLEPDAVDSSSAVAPWWDLAQQLKQDMASIILMSEGDLQVPTFFPVPFIFVPVTLKHRTDSVL